MISGDSLACPPGRLEVLLVLCWFFFFIILPRQQVFSVSHSQQMLGYQPGPSILLFTGLALWFYSLDAFAQLGSPTEISPAHSAHARADVTQTSHRALVKTSVTLASPGTPC